MVFDGTLNDVISPHVIRCTADSLSDINPTLIWWMLVSHVVSTEPAIVECVMSQVIQMILLKTRFMRCLKVDKIAGSEYFKRVVDTSNAKDIGIIFSHISYDHVIAVYFCISTSNDSASITNFRIRVSG